MALGREAIQVIIPLRGPSTTPVAAALSSNVRPRRTHALQAPLPETPKTMHTDPRTLEELLEEVADVLFPEEDIPPVVTHNTTSSMGDTSLHAYLWRSDDSAACFLLSHGANANAAGEMGETLLHAAVRTAQAHTIAALLAAGASEYALSEFGDTPAQLAQILGRDAVYQEALSVARQRKSSGAKAGGEA